MKAQPRPLCPFPEGCATHTQADLIAQQDREMLDLYKKYYGAISAAVTALDPSTTASASTLSEGGTAAAPSCSCGT